jgi:hypothetical protein
VQLGDKAPEGVHVAALKEGLYLLDMVVFDFYTHLSSERLRLRLVFNLSLRLICREEVASVLKTPEFEGSYHGLNRVKSTGTCLY